jgi:hypothetical protein
MGFLENLENSLDFPRDGEQSLALKLFKDQCCESCLCGSERDHEKSTTFQQDTLPFEA